MCRFLFLRLLLIGAVLTSISSSYCSGQKIDWEKFTPAKENTKAELITSLIKEIKKGTYQNIHGLLVIKNGKLVVEEYFNGYDRDTLHYTASVSKSIGSMLIGIAMQQNLLDGLDNSILDRSISDLFPKYEAIIKSNPKKEKILFRHVLSMSAGLEWDETSHPYSDPRNDWNAASHSRDPIKYVLEKPVIFDPGSEFNYNGGLTIMLSCLVERVTGKHADVFARQHLFSPLGIKDFRWERLGNGLTDTDGGLHLKPRDMAKLGYLCLNNGVWNGKRIVPADWIHESIKEHMINTDSPNYGFQWWCGDFQYNFRSVYAFLASGHGGQKIYVFPSLNTVIVLTHQVFDNPLGELNNTSILSKYILPDLTGATKNKEIFELEPEILKNYVGKYESGGNQMTLFLKDNKLFASGDDGMIFDLAALNRTHFVGSILDLVDVCFEFTKSADGKIESVTAAFGFNKRTFQKIR